MSERGCTRLCNICSGAAVSEPCRSCGADLCAHHEPTPGRACDRCVRRGRVAVLVLGGFAWMLVIGAMGVAGHGGVAVTLGGVWLVSFAAALAWGARSPRTDPMVPADPRPPSLPTARIVERRHP